VYQFSTTQKHSSLNLSSHINIFRNFKLNLGMVIFWAKKKIKFGLDKQSTVVFGNSLSEREWIKTTKREWVKKLFLKCNKTLKYWTSSQTQIPKISRSLLPRLLTTIHLKKLLLYYNMYLTVIVIPPKPFSLCCVYGFKKTVVDLIRVWCMTPS
jgi:hypothetical protein